MAIKRRKWWAAGLLSGIAPGVGQIYNGQLKKAALLYGLSLLPVIAGLLIGILGLLPVNMWTIAALVIPSLLIYGYIIFEAGTTARRLKDSYQTNFYNKWYFYLLCIVIVVVTGNVASATLKTTVVQAYRMLAKSMAPTLAVGDRVLTAKCDPCDPKRGDVSCFYIQKMKV
ncbi:MAG TPA: S26 family signal peptidase [Nitrospirales bacterium]|nr:S26 family signal peptidase [Nitrospirales bacterium]